MRFFRKKKSRQSLPEIPEADKIALLRWEGLSRREGTVKRIFFRKDGKRRILIVNRVDGFCTYRCDRLTLYDEDEREFFSAYGFWEPEDGGGIYDGEELLLRDLSVGLADYEEESVPDNL